MSRVEKWSGRLRKLILPKNVTIEDWCHKQCNNRNIEKYDPKDTWRETYDENFCFPYDTYFIIVNDEVYDMMDHEEDEYREFSKFWKNPDGTIGFITEFYNGGTCLGEQIEDGINTIRTL